MVNFKTGIIATIGVVIALLISFVLFPIVESGLINMNDSGWLTAQDQVLLANIPALYLVMTIMILIGGSVIVMFLMFRNN